jgi:hypothetical protein
MKKTITYITTADTKKTYEFPDEEAKNPEIVEIKLFLGFAKEDSGYVRTSSYSYPEYPKAIIYVERQTLENAGILPLGDYASQSEKEEPTETPEDLILRLLEMVGVNPSLFHEHS